MTDLKKYYLIFVLLTVFLLNASAFNIDSVLNFEERNWLEKNKNSLVYAPNPGWPPCDYVDSKGIHRGIVSDYIAVFEKKLGVTFNRSYLPSWNDILN